MIGKLSAEVGPYSSSKRFRPSAPLTPFAPFEHAEFVAFNESATKLFTRRKKTAVPQLKGFGKDKATDEIQAQSDKATIHSKIMDFNN